MARPWERAIFGIDTDPKRVFENLVLGDERQGADPEDIRAHLLGLQQLQNLDWLYYDPLDEFTDRFKWHLWLVAQIRGALQVCSLKDLMVDTEEGIISFDWKALFSNFFAEKWYLKE